MGAGAPEDFFATLDVMSIVVEVDKDLINGGGPIVSVWGSSHMAPAAKVSPAPAKASPSPDGTAGSPDARRGALWSALLFLLLGVIAFVSRARRGGGRRRRRSRRGLGRHGRGCGRLGRPLR